MHAVIAHRRAMELVSAEFSVFFLFSKSHNSRKMPFFKNSAIHLLALLISLDFSFLNIFVVLKILQQFCINF